MENCLGLAIRTEGAAGSVAPTIDHCAQVRLCLHQCDGEAVFDTLAVRMGFLEFLTYAFHVRTRLFQVRLQLLVILVHLLVETEVRVVLNLVVLSSHARGSSWRVQTG